jgi:hypothetical protein
MRLRAAWFLALFSSFIDFAYHESFTLHSELLTVILSEAKNLSLSRLRDPSLSFTAFRTGCQGDGEKS